MNNEFFRRSAAKHHCDVVEKFALGHMVVVVFGQRDGVACRHTARNNADFVHVVAMLHKFCDDCVSALVIRSDTLVGLGYETRFLCRTRHNLVDGLADVLHGDNLSIVSCRQNRGLVEDIFDIRAREASRKSCKGLEVDVRSKRFVACVYLKYFLSALDVGDVDVDLSVESARTHKCRVENIGTVGCRHNDNGRTCLEAVHLHEQLVERLLSLVVAAAETRASLTTDRIDFVDEDDARHILLRLLEQVSDARRADAYEHLHEVRTAY